jgi:hypothetical protein
VSGHVTTAAKWSADLKRLVLEDQVVFHAAIRRMKNLQHGEPFEVEAVRLLGCRTSPMNREYFGYVVRPVALHTQQSVNEIHRFFKAEFLPREHIALADRETGDVKIERDLEIGSTRRMPEQVFKHYMEQCREFGMTTFGIDFSPAGLWEQFGIGEG